MCLSTPSGRTCACANGYYSVSKEVTMRLKGPRSGFREQKPGSGSSSGSGTELIEVSGSGSGSGLDPNSGLAPTRKIINFACIKTTDFVNIHELG